MLLVINVIYLIGILWLAGINVIIENMGDYSAFRWDRKTQNPFPFYMFFWQSSALNSEIGLMNHIHSQVFNLAGRVDIKLCRKMKKRGNELYNKQDKLRHSSRPRHVFRSPKLQYQSYPVLINIKTDSGQPFYLSLSIRYFRSSSSAAVIIKEENLRC